MIHIVPFCEIDGIRTFADSEILDIYNRMKANNTVDGVFLDEQITTATDFLRAMKYGENHLYLVLDDERVVAFFWLNRFEGKTARLHFVFLDLDRKDKVDIGKQCVGEIMALTDNTNEYVFDMLIGVTPIANEPACRYVQAVGLKKIGVLPFGVYNRFTRKSEAAMIGYLSREVDNEGV